MGGFGHAVSMKSLPGGGEKGQPLYREGFLLSDLQAKSKAPDRAWGCGTAVRLGAGGQLGPCDPLHPGTTGQGTMLGTGL